MLLQIALRTVFFYLAVVIVMRIMGKREIGNLSPFDLVVSIMIAELAALPIENTDKPLLEGLVPLVVLLTLEMLLSYLALKSEVVRSIVNGRPSLIIIRGRIMENEMRKLRYSIDDLLMGLRNKGVVDVADVEYAILEPSGILSVIPIAQRRSITPADLKLDVPTEELPLMLVTDGQIHWDNVKQAGWEESSFRQMLCAQGVPSAREILIAYLDPQGRLQFQLKASSKPSDAHTNRKS